MELVETSTFTRQIADLLSDDEYAQFQLWLAANPARGAVIKGSGGIRKTRAVAGSRGKRGGARIIYCWAVRRNVILLLYAYAKSDSADLTRRQVALLGKAVRREFSNETEDV